MNRRELGTFAIAGAAAIAAAHASTTSVVAGEASLGPVLAVVSHPVADFAAWRTVYDEAQPARDAAGVTGAEIFVDVSNPAMVVVIHRFPSVEAADAFFKNPDLAAAMKRGGGTAPPTIILAKAA